MCWFAPTEPCCGNVDLIGFDVNSFKLNFKAFGLVFDLKFYLILLDQ